MDPVQINFSVPNTCRSNSIVPVAVKLGRRQMDCCQIVLGYLDSSLVMTTIESCMDLESVVGFCVRDQTDHDLITDERVRPPVRRDVAEHPMLDLVPLACARWEVADADEQPRLVGEALQLDLPQSCPYAVTASTVRSDEQLGRCRVGRPTHPRPPLPDRGDREGGRVVIGADRNPPLVLREIVDPVRDRLALGEAGEVVRVDAHGVSLRLPLPSGVLEGPDELLLLGVDRDRGQAMALKFPDFARDVVELRVAIGVVGPLVGLADRLEAEAELVQESADGLVADRVATCPQLLR